MSLLSIIALLVVVGMVLYLVNQIPIDTKIKSIIHAVVIFMVIVWLIQLVVGPLPYLHLGIR